MAQISRQAGTTSQVTLLFIQDSSSTAGAGLTGLSYNTASLTCYYKRSSGTVAVAVTLANITTLGTYVSGGFREVDAANLPGVYEFHPPDAALASGADSVAFVLKGAANMAPCPMVIELTGTSNQDAVRGGMTALPNANASTSGGLLTYGASTGQINPASGNVTVGTNNDKTGYSLTQSFPSNFASLAITAGGIVQADMQTIKTQAVTAASGVTFPASIGTSTYAGADTSGITTLLSRIPSQPALDSTAPSWYTAPNPPTAATGTVLASPTPTTTTFTLSGVSGDLTTARKMVLFGGSLAGHPCRVASATPSGGNWAITLTDPLPTAPTASATATIFGLPPLDDSPGTVTLLSRVSASGVMVSPAGLDAVAIESGINARQALAAILAANAGQLSGADTGSIIINGAGAGNTAARITATTDASGNRQSVTLNLP